jgi:nucleotide-binding universal stress UspA family protein
MIDTTNTSDAVLDETTPARIVVGVDGSEQSKRALRWAQHLAAPDAARIEAVMVWEPPVTWGYGWSALAGGWDPMADAEKELIATVDEVFGAERPVGLTLRTVEGYPAHRLLEAAEGASMLVVGSRGHGGLAGVLLGSVSALCAEHAHCAVLVVHDTEPPTAPSPS